MAVYVLCNKGYSEWLGMFYVIKVIVSGCMFYVIKVIVSGYVCFM